MPYGVRTVAHNVTILPILKFLRKVILVVLASVFISFESALVYSVTSGVALTV